jgi:hypothetical protein
MLARDLPLDRAEADRFLDLLLGASSDQEKFTFQTLDDNQTRKDGRLTRSLRGRFADVADQLEQLNKHGAGIYVAINKLRPGRRIAANVCGIRAVFIDLDGAPLDPVFTWKLVPHIVVESSPRKFHVYWRADSSVDVDCFSVLQRKLATVFNSDPSVSDPPRILRLPGAWHQKVRRDGHRSDPFKSTIIYPKGGEASGKDE